MVGKLGRSIAIGVLVVLLVLSLGAANLTLGVERTVLNGEYVADSLEEEDAYAVFVEEAQQQLENETETSGEGPSPDELLSTVVTEEYLQNQTEANIDRAYAYLHGEREDLYVAVDTTPLKDDIAAELASQLMAEQGIAEYDPEIASMTESESQFQTVRENFKAEQKQRIQNETSVELTDEQLETAYDDRREQIREEAIAQFESQVAGSDQPAELESAIVDLGTVYIDALVAEDPSYDQFMSDVEDARADLEAAVEDLARTQLDEELPDTMVLTEQLGQEERAQLDEELPDTMVLTEQLGQEERAQLEELRGFVSILDLLVYLLPLIGIGIALLIGWVAATRSSGLFVVGGAVTVTGLISAVGFMGAGSRIESELASTMGQGEVSAGLSELVVSLVSKTVSVFVTQSWLVVLLGLILIAVGVGIRRDLLPVEDQPDQESPAGTAASETASNDGTGGSRDDPAVDVTEESEDLEQAAPLENDEDVSGADEHSNQ